MTTLVLFNNKGGVGKTSLCYNLAWAFADLDLSVVAVDLDPQANLTAMFLDNERLEQLWPDSDHVKTVYGAIQPLIKGTGDISQPHVEDVHDNIGLVAGDLSLSLFEDSLSENWPKCLDRQERAFRVVSAFHRVIRAAMALRQAHLALVDVGPNLGAINRAALVAAEHVLVPLNPDLFSLQGLRNLGPALRRWREEWRERVDRNPEPGLSLPPPAMRPVGYVVQQHAVRLDRPVLAYDRWMKRIPHVYREAVLDQEPSAASVTDPSSDEHCVALLKHYRSLMPMAMEARKPIFHLRPADGAIGSHADAVQEARRDFERLARAVAERCGVELPP